MPVYGVSIGKNDEHQTRTIRSESLDCAGRAKSAGVCHAHDGDQDDGIEDGWENLDAGKLDCNDKR